MKIPSALLVIAVGAASILVYLGCASNQTGETPPTSYVVIVRKDMVVIPGTRISAADTEAMNNVLKRFGPSLYKVDTYENGVLKHTRGTLQNLEFGKELDSEIAASRANKDFTGVVAVGTRGSIVHISPAPDDAGWPALVNALTPILEKYTPVGSHTR